MIPEPGAAVPLPADLFIAVYIIKKWFLSETITNLEFYFILWLLSSNLSYNKSTDSLAFCSVVFCFESKFKFYSKVVLFSICENRKN